MKEETVLRVGVLLSGCGFYDGTDVHEAVLSLLALDRMNARIECLAPGGMQAGVVDHATGLLSEGGEPRSVLAEAARIARGRILPVSEARSSRFGALVIPGGQGVARSLMRGAAEAGRTREADPEVAGLILQVLAERKPIGAVSLAGALVSTALGQPLEEDPFSTPATEIRVDEERGIVWTPGYLASDRLSQVALGIDRMVEEVLRRAARGLPVVS